MPKGESAVRVADRIARLPEKANDLPAWFFLNNPYTMNITITKIDKNLRKNFIIDNSYSFSDYAELSVDEREKAVETMASLTEGFSTFDLLNFLCMCGTKGFQIKNAKKAKQIIIDKKNEENRRAMTHGIVIPGTEMGAVEVEA